VPLTIRTPIRSHVQALVARALAGAVERGDLPALLDEAGAPAIEVQHPSHPEHGDVALSLAMKLARPMRRPPLAIGGRSHRSWRRRRAHLCHVARERWHAGAGHLTASLWRYTPAGSTWAKLASTIAPHQRRAVSANPDGPPEGMRAAFAAATSCVQYWGGAPHHAASTSDTGVRCPGASRAGLQAGHRCRGARAGCVARQRRGPDEVGRER
jgi:hypothetical protein